MKVLIIGGTGNISTAIVEQLLAKGGVDLTLCHRSAGGRGAGRVREVAADRTDHAAFEARMRELERFDCVVDMVGYAPEDARSLVRAFGGRTGQLVFCSTVDVYSKTQPRYPVTAGAPREPEPRFEYAHHKAECERILERAHEAGELPLTIIRPAATYNDTWTPISLIGPGPSLLRRIREGRPVLLLGDGQSLWVSCHRDDQAVAFVGAIGNEKAIGRAYDTPGDEVMTWTEYYATAARVMGAPPLDRVCVPAELLARMAPAEASWCAWNFQFNNVFDSSAARADLGFAPRVTWAEGVRRMVAHHDAAGAIDAAPPVPLYDRIVETWRRIEREAVAALAPA